MEMGKERSKKRRGRRRPKPAAVMEADMHTGDHSCQEKKEEDEQAYCINSYLSKKNSGKIRRYRGKIETQ